MSSGKRKATRHEPSGWWNSIDDNNEVERRFKHAMHSPWYDERKDQGQVAIMNPDPFGSEVHWPFETSYHPMDGVVFTQPHVLLEALGSESDIFKNKLIILEDLGRSWIEILGEALNIPPYVFALHWTLPTDLIKKEATPPLGQSTARHFIFPYREILPIRIREKDKALKNKSTFMLNCISNRAVSRKIRKKVSEGGYSSHRGEICEQLLSYWSQSLDPRDPRSSWFVLILVDPKPLSTIIECLSDKSRRVGGTDTESAPRRPMLSSQAPPFRRNLLIGVNFDDPPFGVRNEIWRSTTASSMTFQDDEEHISTIFNTTAPEMPLFDELLFGAWLSSGTHPLSCTNFARKLMLSKTSLFVTALFQETFALTIAAAQGIESLTDFDFKKLDEKPWTDEWREEFFSHLWELREDLELLGYEMRRNRRLIRRIDAVFFARSTQLPAWELEDIRAELEQWEDLEDTRQYAFDIMSRTTDSYLQSVQATGAQFANIQAESSRKVTGLATLFVPASLCAAVLAIPSFAGAGDVEKFWIFWAVSVPLAVMLAVFLLTGFWGWIKSLWHRTKVFFISRFDSDVREERNSEKIEGKKRTNISVSLRKDVPDLLRSRLHKRRHSDVERV